MKKTLTLILALALSLGLSAQTFAADPINQDTDPKTQDVEVSTSIEPSYEVVIPADVRVEFNATSTPFGQVGLSKAKLEPNHQVKVKMEYDKKMENKEDTNKYISYFVKNASTGYEYLGSAFYSPNNYTDLSIEISQSAWDGAYAGEYSDTITFTVSYEAKP